jgi:lysophospholipase L1-like esterase
MVPPDHSCYLRGTEGFGVTCYFANSEIGTPYRGQEGESIVVLGDSYTEATQVSNSEKYVSLTETILRERGYNVDLHNLGDSNRTLADFVYIAPLVNKTYAPKIVVLQTNISFIHDALNARRKNHFAVDDHGGLYLVHRDLAKENLLFRNLVLSSGLLTYSAYRWNRVSENFAVKKNPKTDSGSASVDQIIAQIQLLFAAYPNSQIVLLVIPNAPVVSATGLTWTIPDDSALLAALEKVEGLKVIYPVEVFKELYKQYEILPRGFNNTLPNVGHMNRYGHIAVAQALADTLEMILK